MKSPLPTRQLSARPDLEQLRREAKEPLDGFLAGKPEATAEANRFYRDADRRKFALHHAQLVLARSYALDSWPKLKAFNGWLTSMPPTGRKTPLPENGPVADARLPASNAAA